MHMHFRHASIITYVRIYVIRIRTRARVGAYHVRLTFGDVIVIGYWLFNHLCTLTLSGLGIPERDYDYRCHVRCTSYLRAPPSSALSY